MSDAREAERLAGLHLQELQGLLKTARARAEQAEAALRDEQDNIGELLSFLEETATTLRRRDEPEVARIIDNVLRKFGRTIAATTPGEPRTEEAIHEYENAEVPE